MISAQFEKLRDKGERALVAFVTAGDPGLDELPAIIAMLESAGVDIIEVGLPFSDPIADGPVIQASSQRALDRGVTPPLVLEAIEKSHATVPIVLMGYYNTALRIGLTSFAKCAKSAGVSGVILSDLPPEESLDWKRACVDSSLDTIFLVAPTSTDERLNAACEVSTGFVYAVSRTGVTGVQSGLSGDAANLVERVRQFASTPICVGFGISKPDHVSEICRVADGAVVGSWLVDAISNKWGSEQGQREIESQVRALKEATRI